MKASFRNSMKVSLLAALTVASFVSFAQDKKEKKNTIRVRIEQDINGKTKVHEKSFDATGLTEKQREDLVQDYQDSVMANNKENVRGTKVEVENFSDNERDGKTANEDHFERKFEFDSEKPRIKNYSRNRDSRQLELEEDNDVIIREKPRARVYRYDGDKNLNHNFDLDMKSLNENLNQMGKDLKFEFKTFPDVFDFDGSASGKTVRGLSVYPNNPKTEILNLRFSSQQKGDVSIKVMDLKGNVIAKDEVKDFSGDYVGQINIGKQKGVVFVMVTQGEDGSVKRVNLSSDKE